MQPLFALSPEQISRFREGRFLALRGLTTANEIARLREIYDRLFDGKVGYERGRQLDMVTPHDETTKPSALSKFVPQAGTLGARAVDHT